jgi:hypothetical protein
MLAPHLHIVYVDKLLTPTSCYTVFSRVVRFLRFWVAAEVPSNSTTNSTVRATDGKVERAGGGSQLKLKPEPDAADNTTTGAGRKANVTAAQLCARMQVSSFVKMLQQDSSCTCRFRSL